MFDVSVGQVVQCVPHILTWNQKNQKDVYIVNDKNNILLNLLELF